MDNRCGQLFQDYSISAKLFFQIIFYKFKQERDILRDMCNQSGPFRKTIFQLQSLSILDLLDMNGSNPFLRHYCDIP